jgi:N-acyl-D-aspartate/D-glutamate deacylase
MTGRPAQVFGLADRGEIAEKKKADLVVFDPETVIDVGTFDNPRQYPLGIAHVIVNGQFAVRDSAIQENVLAGKVLRKSF